MENVPTGAVVRKPAEEWFATAGTFMGRVWSAVRAFRGALHKEPGQGPPEQPLEARPPSLLERGELPESYGRTKVVAMAVNPYLIQVYWELPAPQLDSPEPASLRFRETGSGNAFNVNVDLSAKNWYVHLWSPDQRYDVELGVQRNGEFLPLAHSNPVQTPRAWPVAEVRESYTRAPEPKPAPAPTRSEPSPEAPRLVEPAPEARPLPVAAAAPAPIATVPAPTPRLQPNTPPAAPPATRPTRASDVLREKLSELYGFRRWEHRPRSVPLAFSPANAPTTSPSGVDLTARAEARFAPGVSSQQPRS